MSAAFGWMLGGVLVGIPAYGLLNSLWALWRERRAAKLAKKVPDGARWVAGATSSLWASDGKGGWVKVGDVMTPPPSFECDITLWELPADSPPRQVRPARYATVDELLGPTVEEPPRD